MLNDATELKKIYLAAGYTDLRRWIDDLATMVRFQFQLDPYDKNTLFLFCGKRQIISKVFCGKAMAFYFFTSDWITERSVGHVPQKKSDSDLNEEKVWCALRRYPVSRWYTQRAEPPVLRVAATLVFKIEQQKFVCMWCICWLVLWSMLQSGYRNWNWFGYIHF